MTVVQLFVTLHILCAEGEEEESEDDEEEEGPGLAAIYGDLGQVNDEEDGDFDGEEEEEEEGDDEIDEEEGE